MKVKFSVRFKELRKELRLSQKEVASFLNVTQSTVAKWEAGDIEASYQKLVDICILFKTSSDYILGIID